MYSYIFFFPGPNLPRKGYLGLNLPIPREICLSYYFNALKLFEMLTFCTMYFHLVCDLPCTQSDA